MPLYEYRCKTCESTFEVLQSLNESDDELACPQCDSSDTAKVFAPFASLGSAKSAAACDTGST